MSLSIVHWDSHFVSSPQSSVRGKIPVFSDWFATQRCIESSIRRKRVIDASLLKVRHHITITFDYGFQFFCRIFLFLLTALKLWQELCKLASVYKIPNSCLCNHSLRISTQMLFQVDTTSSFHETFKRTWF